MASATLLELNGKRDMDKAKALESALAQIERQFGKGSIMKLGSDNPIMDVEATSTGSLGLDIALGIGGLPKGRIIEIYGPESSGKTTLTLQAIAAAIKLAEQTGGDAIDLSEQGHGSGGLRDSHRQRRGSWN